MARIKGIISRFKSFCRDFSWTAYCKCRSSKVEYSKGGKILPRKYTLIELYPKAKIVLETVLSLGVKQVKGSRKETRLLIEDDAKLIVKSQSTIYAGSYIRIMKGGELVLDGCLINEDVQITCGNQISIGEGTNVGRGVVIRSYDSHIFEERGLSKSEPIIIGKNVWIGQNAIIYKGVSIGDNSIIGAGSIITEDVPFNSRVGNLK